MNNLSHHFSSCRYIYNIQLLSKDGDFSYSQSGTVRYTTCKSTIFVQFYNYFIFSVESSNFSLILIKNYLRYASFCNVYIANTTNTALP